MPGLPDQCPTQIDRHIPPCAEAYPSTLAPPSPLPPLPVILFHPVTLSCNWAPPSLRYSPGPFLLEKFLPCLLPGQIPAHAGKKELQGPLPSLEFGSPTPVTQAEAKGFSNTKLQW